LTGDLIILLSGLVTLYFGASFIVKGGSGIALLLGVKPIIIGLSMIAFGTSLPELTVGVLSGIQGTPGISLGNVVGSNICNVLLIFGVMAIIRPVEICEDCLRKNIPAVLGSSALLWILAADGMITRLDSIVLLLAFTLFIENLITGSKEGNLTDSIELSRGKKLSYGVMVLAGIAILIYGGWASVRGGTGVAEAIGIPPYIIGLTVIAVGTSLPELAVGAVASWKGEVEIPIGNALGSNIFNSLSIIGVTGLISPFAVDSEVLTFSMPVMLSASMAFLPLARIGKGLSRLEGAAFLLAYTVYIAAVVV